MGRAFFRRERKEARDPGVREAPVLGIALMGEWKESSWSGKSEPAGFPHLKGLIENLLDRLRVDLRWKYGSQAGFLHPIESAELFPPDSSTPVAVLGMLHPKVKAGYGLKRPVAVVEFYLDSLLSAPKRPLQFQPYELHTGTVRDVNIVVGEKFRHEEVLASLPPKVPNLQEIILNSVYQGRGLPDGHKALHYSFLYRHAERTLTDEEVNTIQDQVKAELLKNPAIRIK
jgi:phenylalanyl-tRNA synthetase beta chain